jgi:hypothetical protein
LGEFWEDALVVNIQKKGEHMEDNREVRKTLDAVLMIQAKAETLWDTHEKLKDAYHEAISGADEADQVLTARGNRAAQIKAAGEEILQDFFTRPSRRNLDRMYEVIKKVEAANHALGDAGRELVDAQARLVSVGADFLESLQALHENGLALEAASKANNVAGLREYEKQLAEVETENANLDERSFVN